jgi:lysophospholipase L1-like esterase
MSRLPRRKPLLFALTAMVLAGIGAMLALVAVDVFLHRKVERSGGVNVWGYRGPAMGRKAANEYRIVVLGGSAAYGYGVLWNETIPSVLEELLNARSRGSDRVYRVVNLGYPNEAAYSFRFTLEDYGYLHPDMVVLYEGYNDLGDEPRLQVFRRESPVYRLTGYLPISPVMFREKAFAMLNGGDVAQGYRDILKWPKQTVFRPSMSTQVGAAALEIAADTAASLEAQLGKLTRSADELQHLPPTADCERRWTHYCSAHIEAIATARARGAAVLVVAQPNISDRHVAQQRALQGLMHQRYAGDPGVAYFALGTGVNLRDMQLSFDGMHLTPEGNRLAAELLVDPVLALVGKAR